MSYLIPDWLYRMPGPEPTAELQLQLKHPSLNWEGNLHENLKSFEYRARVLLEGPYKKYNEQIKVAALPFYGQVTRVLSCTTQLIGVIKTKTSGKIYSQHLKHISSHVRLSCKVGINLAHYIVQTVRISQSSWPESRSW